MYLQSHKSPIDATCTSAIEMTQKRRRQRRRLLMLHRHWMQSRKHLPHIKTLKLSVALYAMLSHSDYGKCEICAITWNCIRMTILYIFRCCCCCCCIANGPSCCLFTFYDLHFMHEQGSWRAGDEDETEEWTHAPRSPCTHTHTILQSTIKTDSDIFVLDSQFNDHNRWNVNAEDNNNSHLNEREQQNKIEISKKKKEDVGQWGKVAMNMMWMECQGSNTIGYCFISHYIVVWRQRHRRHHHRTFPPRSSLLHPHKPIKSQFNDDCVRAYAFASIVCMFKR